MKKKKTNNLKIQKRKKSAKQSEYYVQPKHFLKLITEYYDTNIITDELAETLLKIAQRTAFAPNFINYTYKEEMIGDAVVKMFAALKNKKYDLNNGSNPFSYFTIIVFHAFINRIKKEKREREIINSYRDEVYDTLIETGHIPYKTKSTGIEDEESPEIKGR